MALMVKMMIMAVTKLLLVTKLLVMMLMLMMRLVALTMKKMSLLQGMQSEARLSQRQMMMIAKSRYSGSAFLSFLDQHDVLN